MKIQRSFVSEIDQLLQAYDKAHPTPTETQQKEITKHQRIFKLREDPNFVEPVSNLWADF